MLECQEFPLLYKPQFRTALLQYYEECYHSIDLQSLLLTLEMLW